jgi:hypothetical protein
LLCGRLNEHEPRRGSRITQRFPECANGIRVAGDLNSKGWIAVQLVVGRGVLHHHFAEIDIELLGKNHGDRRVCALPHFDLRHHQRDLSGPIDADESVGANFPSVLSGGSSGSLTARAGR